jgi:hypothetical protein
VYNDIVVGNVIKVIRLVSTLVIPKHIQEYRTVYRTSERKEYNALPRGGVIDIELVTRVTHLGYEIRRKVAKNKM